MSIHHFAYLFGTDELLDKGELLMLVLSGNHDIINICLCSNTCVLSITQHLLVSMQCDLWIWFQDPEAFLWLCLVAHTCSSVDHSAGASSALGHYS